nr:integrase, catalytic region, zinc finger, CCHC-type, peptidase aspartic, catalytic [Tanacetum cinerariifolium]
MATTHASVLSGKDNGVNILKSIDEGPFQMGTFRETLAEGHEGSLHLGPERPRVYSDLSPEEKERGTMHGVQVQLVMGELKTKSGMQIQVKQSRLCATTAMENRVALDEEQLLFIAADDCDAFDFDVNEAPTAQIMFMANLSFVYPVYDEAGPSYDSDILSEYVKDNAVPVVQSNVSSAPNDVYMMISNDMHEQPAQHVSVTTQHNVVNKSLTAELITYKEQVELYERRAKFELTKKRTKD